MCLYVRKKNKIKILNYLALKLFFKKTKKDIIVYKIYKVSEEDEIIFKSIHRGTYHSIGKQPTVNIGVSTLESFNAINEGYHSFVEYPTNEYLEKNHKVVECIIPKGSIVFKGGINSYNKEDGYASNKLIISKIL